MSGEHALACLFDFVDKLFTALAHIAATGITSSFSPRHRIRGDGPFVQQFPGGERAPTLDEVKELQTRLTALGFDTQGNDGRIGSDTMKAIKAFQQKVGMEPADGYAGLKVLARIRQMR